MQNNASIVFCEEELHFDYIRSAGPGGQNVNKVATACQLRFDVEHSVFMSQAVKTRLIKLAGSRMTDDGQLVIEAKRYRTQEQNRQDAIARLSALVEKAGIEPKDRKATRPSLSAKAERVDSKKKRGETKQSRRIKPSDLEQSRLWSDVIITLHHPFVGGQFTQTHRTAGVHALGGDGNLGTQAHLRPVGKAGGSVYIDRR